MPILNLLDFARTGLSVSYRASAEPQVLEIKVVCAKKPGTVTAPGNIAILMNAINHGAAGGAEFRPSLGRAKALSGPVKYGEPGADGPRYAWKLEVAGVSPLFLRTFIEQLRIAGSPGPVKSMSITGSLKVDQSPLSVTEREVLAWLDDPRAYPGEWPDPGFPYEEGEAGSGASIRVKLEDAATDELLNAFSQEVGSLWMTCVKAFADKAGKAQGRMAIAHQAKRGKTEMSLHFDHFSIAREPARWTLVNLLSRFHEKVARIKHADILIA